MVKLRLYKHADQQPSNIAIPTFFSQIKDYMPSVLNSPALQGYDQQLNGLNQQISNAVTSMVSKQDPEQINKSTQTIMSQLGQLLNILQAKLQGGGGPEIKPLFDQIKSYSDQIAKWSHTTSPVAALPLQQAKPITIPQKPFAAKLKGPRKVPTGDLMAPKTPQEWEKVRQQQKVVSPQTQAPTATPDEISGASQSLISQDRT